MRPIDNPKTIGVRDMLQLQEYGRQLFPSAVAPSRPFYSSDLQLSGHEGYEGLRGIEKWGLIILCLTTASDIVASNYSRKVGAQSSKKTSRRLQILLRYFAHCLLREIVSQSSLDGGITKPDLFCLRCQIVISKRVNGAVRFAPSVFHVFSQNPFLGS